MRLQDKLDNLTIIKQISSLVVAKKGKSEENQNKIIG